MNMLSGTENEIKSSFQSIYENLVNIKKDYFVNFYAPWPIWFSWEALKFMVHDYRDDLTPSHGDLTMQATQQALMNDFRVYSSVGMNDLQVNFSAGMNNLRVNSSVGMNDLGVNSRVMCK